MPKLLMACPFNREKQLWHVLKTWGQQTVKTDLVLVANSLGEWSKIASSIPRVHIAIGQASIGGARNKAIEIAKKLEAEWLIAIDDDNYYSPQYVEMIQNHISDDIDILSQGIAFVRFGETLRLFSAPLNFYPGHCTSFRVHKAIEFPEWNLSEDVKWSEDMKKLGTKAKHLPPWHSIYVRNKDGSNHAYQASETIFMKAFGPSKLIGNVRDSFVEKEKTLDEYSELTASDEAIFASLERMSLFGSSTETK